ncbi:MAG: hypothetical protein MCSN_5280 [Candidatus Microsyncoccus archaeolyticus]|jgi:hypothetical protein|nr:MAG: hypothetical protein MCSN_5280 [Candidatus Parcubacteria bacterium]
MSILDLSIDDIVELEEIMSKKVDPFPKERVDQLSKLIEHLTGCIKDYREKGESSELDQFSRQRITYSLEKIRKFTGDK